MIDFIRFTKMHGAGNDYIYVNTMEFPVDCPEELAVRWSCRHTGIGADGLVLVGASEVADFSMRIFNADGSEAMMCGNASRCIGKYVYEKSLTTSKVVRLETLSGIRELRLCVSDGCVEEVTVDMGMAEVVERLLALEVDGMCYEGMVVSMGNPHFVVFTDDLGLADIDRLGPLLECHPYFANRTNVEFVHVLSPGRLRMRVWERGSGVTLACGTGACASAVAGVLNGFSGEACVVEMDGGCLSIRLDAASGRVFMTGGAAFVYEGEIGLGNYK
ncbi:MAG: diaminopimelate epimerase [Tannerellaceae bacterium]|nr:diaminopimelate epimerase [Tannerellaceae bacterium]